MNTLASVHTHLEMQGLCHNDINTSLHNDLEKHCKGVHHKDTLYYIMIQKSILRGVCLAPQCISLSYPTIAHHKYSDLEMHFGS